MEWKAADVLAVVALIGAFALKAMGVNSIVDTIIITILAAYYVSRYHLQKTNGRK